jgi:hypothetical protein
MGTPKDTGQISSMKALSYTGLIFYTHHEVHCAVLHEEGPVKTMSMPEIPENKHRPSFPEVEIDLLESIALEEIALSHLLNAEAEKIQAFVGKHHDFPTHPSNCEIIRFNRVATQFVRTIVMKEWLLLNKLETVLGIEEEECCEEE